MRCCARPIGVGRPLKASVGCRSIADACSAVWPWRIVRPRFVLPVQVCVCFTCGRRMCRRVAADGARATCCRRDRSGRGRRTLPRYHRQGTPGHLRALCCCTSSLQTVGICDGDFFIRFRNGAARRGDASRPLWMIGWIRPRGQCHYIRVFYVRTAVQNFQLEFLRPRPSIGVSSSCWAGRWSGMAPPRAGRWFSLGWDRNRESGIPTGTLLRNGPYEARNRSLGPRYPG